MTTPLVQSRLNMVETIVTNLEEYYKSGTPINLNIEEIIERELELPQDPLTISIFSHPYILREFIEAICSELQYNIGDILFKRLKGLQRYRKNHKSTIRIRKFRANGGMYYSRPFITTDGYYTFWHHEPILLTKSTVCLFDDNWLTGMQPIEVKMLASISLSPQRSCFCFQIGDYYDVPSELVLGVDTEFSEISSRRAQSVTSILERIRGFSAWPSSYLREPHAPFKFSSMDSCGDIRISNLYNSFNLDEYLMLRTSFLLLKCSMLWNDTRRIYAEEACADLFFGIEGCLRMISKKRLQRINFDYKVVLKHIDATFPSIFGYSDILEDIYLKRIQIVHPDPRNASSWAPELCEDDYYDNHGIAIDLAYYAITGDLLSREI